MTTPSKYLIVDAQALNQVIESFKMLGDKMYPASGVVSALEAIPRDNLYSHLFRIDGSEEGSEPVLLTTPPTMGRSEAIEAINNVIAETQAVTNDGLTGGYFDTLQERAGKSGMEISSVAIESLECDPWDSSEKQPADPGSDDPDWIDVIFVTNSEADDPDDIYSMDVYLDQFPSAREREAFLHRPVYDVPLPQVQLDESLNDDASYLVGFVKDFVVQTPRIEKYGVPEYGTDKGAADYIKDVLGLWQFKSKPVDVLLLDSGDDGMGKVVVAARVPRAMIDVESSEPKPSVDSPS